MKKRVLSLLLVLVMLFSMVPTSAFAEEVEGAQDNGIITETISSESEETAPPSDDTAAADPDRTENENAQLPENDEEDEALSAPVSLLAEIENPVATVTTDGVTTEYADMKSAVDATVSGSVLKLLQDDDSGRGSFTIKHSMTIDFNGYTWTPFNVDFQNVGTNITLKDSSAGNSGGFGVTTVYIRFGANVHFENGNHNCSIDMHANSVSAPTVVEVSGGYIKKLEPGGSDENAAIIRLSGACSFGSLGYSVGRARLVVAEGYALKTGSVYRYIDVLTGEFTNPKVVAVPTIKPVTPEGQSLYLGDELSLSADFTVKNVDKATVVAAMTIAWRCDNVKGEEKPFDEGKVYQIDTLPVGSHTLSFSLKYEDMVLESAPITVTVTAPWTLTPIADQTLLYGTPLSLTAELTAVEGMDQDALEAEAEILWSLDGEADTKQPYSQGKTYTDAGTLAVGEHSLSAVLFYKGLDAGRLDIAVTVNPALTPAPLQDATLYYGESVTLSADFAVAEGLDKALAAAETEIIWTLDGESTQPAAYTEGRSYKLPDTLSPGTHTISYTLVYSGISYSVEAANVTVSRFAPAVYDVQVLHSETINTATPLSAIQLSCFCAVPGTIAPDEGQTLIPGQNSLHWTFTPADGNKYSTVTGTVSLYVYDKLPAPQCTVWNGKEAGWSEVPHALSYRVQLYRDGAPYGEPVILDGCSHAFTFTEEGSYTYAVQALGAGIYADSDASEPSDALELVQVSFDTAGYGTIPSQLLIQGQTAQKPADPTGLAPFGGWYYWDTVWDFAAPVTESVTLTAYWTYHSFTVTTDDGTQLLFSFLEDALEEAKKHTHPIIRLYSNIDTVGDFPVIDFPCTIDFNGHQWNLIGDAHLYIRANVEFMDSTEFKIGGITAEDGDITVQNGAALTVNGGEYDVELNIDKNSAASPTTLSVQSGFFTKPVNISTGSILTGIAVLNFNGYCEFSHLNCSMSTGLSIADGFILRNAQDEQVDINNLRIHSGAYWVDRKGIVEPVTPAAQTLTYGDSLNLTADFTIGGETVTSIVKDQFDIEWFLVNGEVVQSRRTFSEGSTLTVETLDRGSYTFRFRLYDGDYYNPSDEISVTVNPKTIAPVITVEEGCIYQGSPVEAEVTVKNGTVPLVEDVDYTLEYRSNTQPGTGYVTVKPKTGSNYTFAAIERSFTIEEAYALVTANGASTLYTELTAAQTAAQTPGATTQVFGEMELDTAWSIPAGNTLDLTAADSIAFTANAPASIDGMLILPADYPLAVEILDSLQGEGAIRKGNTYYPLTKFSVHVSDGKSIRTEQQYANFPVTIEADVMHGQHAGEWSGDVDFTSTSEKQAVFIMPARDVCIHPVYESHRWQYTSILGSDNEGLRADTTCGCGLTEIVNIAPPVNPYYDGSAKSAVMDSTPKTLYSGLKDLAILYEEKLGEDLYSESTAEAPVEPGIYRASTGIDGVTALVEYSILNIYTVELTAAQGIVAYTYRMDDGDELPYTEPFTIGEGSRLEIHVRLDEGLSGYHVRWEDGSTDNPYVIDSVDGDVTLAPSIDNIYTVSFDMHGHGTAIEPMDVSYNTVLEQIEDPTEEGWVFDGWYLDAEYTNAWDASSPVTEDITIHAKWQKAELVLTRDDGQAMTSADCSYARGVLTITGNGPYTLTMAQGIASANHRVVISSGMSLTMSGVSISSNNAAFLIESGADAVTLTLDGSNSLSSGDYYAGLHKENSASLTIGGSGSLTAQGGNFGAGIGGGNESYGSNIVISGGTVTANGGEGGAGIGGGNESYGSNIVISGGTVTANGGDGARAIGSGANYSGTASVDIDLLPQKDFKFTVLERTDYDGKQTTDISTWTDSKLTISFVSTPHEHELEHHEAKEPNCTEVGWDAYDTCKFCDYTTYEEIDALGHDFATKFTLELAATCTTIGIKSKYCTRCDTKTEVTVIPATGHSWNEGTVTTEATCTEAGEKTFTCTACEETKTEAIEALGHDWRNAVETDGEEYYLAATCTEDGMYTEICDRCGEVGEDRFVIDALGHDFEHHEAKEPTCTEKGWDAYDTCKLCDHTTYAEIEALGHNYADEFTVDQAATCTEEGSKSKHCSRCDDKTEVTAIPATGHSWNEGTTTEATCTEAGEITFTCTACEETKTEAIEALGHDYADEFTVDQAATCTEEGSKSKRCSRCDDKTEVTVIPATGHSWNEGNVTTEATCTEAGEITFTCTVCDATKTEAIEALGHDYADEFTVDQAATCTEEGSKSKHCSRCDDKTEVTVIPATGHSWDEGNVTTEATCTEAGEKTFTCTACDATKTEAIEALGHDYADEFTIDQAATCTEEGSKSRHCTRCDDKTEVTAIPATGHSWDEGNVTTEATCTEAGEKTFTCTACEETKTEAIEALGHDYADEFTVDIEATCTEEGSKSKHCTRCDDKTEVTAIPATGHSWNEGTVTTEATCTEAGEKTFTCTACDATKTEAIEALGHDYADEFTVDQAATCTTIGIKSKHCTRCDDKTEATVIPATGHSWDEGTVTTEATCTEDGEKTYHCTACEETKTEAIDVLGHDYADEFTVDIEATCTEAGSKSKHCSRCDDKTEVTVIPATGHNWDEGTVTIEATCTEVGEKTYHCNACDATKTEAIEALGHNYADEFTVDIEATCTEAGSKSKHCTRCDDKTEATVIPATGHSWDEGTVTTEATCTEAGEMTFTCTACEETKTEAIEALGHDYADEFTVDTEPTCTAEGSKSKHCTRCDDKTEVTAIPATGHSWDEGTVTTEATCTEDGEKTYHCTACEETKTEAIEALGHDYADEFTVDIEATCTEAGSKSKHCSRCDDKTEVTAIPATGHSWDEGTVTTEATCTEAGEKTFTCTACDATKTEAIEALGHDYADEFTIDQAATCTEEGSKSRHCTRCDDKTEVTAIPATGHSWDEGTVTTEATCTEAGEKTYHCNACDATKTETIEALGHNLVDDAEIPATCTEDGNEAGKHCTRCDYTEGGENIETLGHHYSTNWIFDSSEHWHECSACHDKKDKAVHSYADSGDTSCSICGYERMLTNYIVSATANPTAGGTVQGGGSYAKDEDVTIIATPNSGYHFVNWTENGQQVSTQATYSFKATANRTLVAVFEADAPATEPVNIYGANVGLYNDIGMNFFVEKDKLDSTASYYAVITMGRSSVTIPQSQWETQDQYFRFGFKGIAAKQMCDEVKVRIYFSDGTPAGDEWIDSLRAYAMRMLEKPTSSAKLKTTLVDMLNYGAAAQIQFNYNTFDLANKLLTAEQQSLATSTMPSVTNRLIKGTGYVGSSISLESNLLLSFYFENIDSSMSAKISYTDHYGHIQSYTISGSQFVANGGYYAVDVTTLAMADVNQLVNCKVYSGSTLVAEATDSIESYIARMSNKGEIYSRVMKFAVSARRYFDSIS